MISCFGPGIRTDYYMRLYESINQSGIPFELIIVGHEPPQYSTPDNFKYIYTTVKPSQCVEIGFRESKYDLVMPVADDEVFHGESVKNIYLKYVKMNNPRALVSYRYVLQGKDISSGLLPANRYYVWEPTSPLAPLCPIMSKKTWQAVGGVDRRFIALYWDLDLAMRVFEYAGLPAVETHAWLADDAFCEEVGQSADGGEHSLYEKYGPSHDRIILDSLWTTPGHRGLFSNIHMKRLAPVEPFEDKDLLTVTQGPRGRWN
ncbi:MAG: hypothetical protein ACFFD4_07640 [Candidatus Odinarchaeota archaeon]